MTEQTTPKQRVEAEAAELEDRAGKLGAFFRTETYATLSKIQKSLLRSQLTAMITYGTILKARLETWDV